MTKWFQRRSYVVAVIILVVGASIVSLFCYLGGIGTKERPRATTNIKTNAFSSPSSVESSGRPLPKVKKLTRSEEDIDDDDDASYFRQEVIFVANRTSPG
jgi:hypothetical protein